MRTARAVRNAVLAATVMTALAGAGCAQPQPPVFDPTPAAAASNGPGPTVVTTMPTGTAASGHQAAPSPSVTAPTHFATLAPGTKLPSDSQCAAWVRARPIPENKGANRSADARTGQRVPATLFGGDAAAAGTRVAVRIDGQFTGTTGEILRWVACKWGIDEDLVRAQAAVESWWLQGTQGDWGTDPSACPPGHGLGTDGRPGQCPQSYGVLQDRYPYMSGGWPGFGQSTSMNADLAYGIWRACFEGYETWLNTVERGQPYAAGDAWGCVGRWFSGRWHTPASDGYVTKVRTYLAQRIWQTPDFQQP